MRGSITYVVCVRPHERGEMMGLRVGKGWVVLICAIVVMSLSAAIVGCSGSSASGGNGGQTINGHPVSEYNSDVDNLAKILSRAKDLDHRIEAMGNPNNFTSQSQVDEYNSYVDQYNSTADEYNRAAKAFSSKYGMTIDGAGSSPTDPDNIDLPSKK